MSIVPPEQTCREYLGRELGYCPEQPDVTDDYSRGFCTHHASERGLLL